MYVDDIKMAGKTENTEPTWKNLMEYVDLGEPTSFLDHENLGCTKESVKEATILWQIKEICSNPGFLLEPRKNYRPALQGNLIQKQYLLGPMTWKVTQGNALKDFEFANKTTQQLHKVATPCMDDPQFN